MPSTPPDGEPVPLDGALPPQVAVGAAGRRFGVYLHVPFCRVRCGYCDFNTYTATELPGGGDQAGFPARLRAELDLAGLVLAAAGVPERPASTVFVGGGTPTLLSGSDLAGLLGAVRDRFGLAPDAEVTTEANPDTVSPELFATLAAAGFSRVSLGMQSAVPHVLATLDRSHDPAGVPPAVTWARDAGLAVSLDLIYGTPGESLDDWRRSLDAVVQLAPDHVSAYALVVEPGTRMAGQVARGQLPAPDDDDLADRYELADRMLAEAGYGWYEVSNWARSPAAACRHNLAYWRGDDWWGAGPGAHSHVGGVRWWNVRHPSAYAVRIDAGHSPAQAHEVLDGDQRRVERVLLGLRLAEGLSVEDLPEGGRRRLSELVSRGLVDSTTAGRVVLTLAGRLLADGVVRELLS